MRMSLILALGWQTQEDREKKFLAQADPRFETRLVSQSLHSTFTDKFVFALISQPRTREGRLNEYTEVRCSANPGLGLPSLPMLLSRWNQRAVRGK